MPGDAVEPVGSGPPPDRQPGAATAWRDPAVVAYAVALGVAIVQCTAALAGVAPFAGHADRLARAGVPYLAAFGLLLALRRGGRRADVSGPPLDPWLIALAVAGGVLAGWLLVRFGLALPAAVGAEHGFYRLKGRITSPLGDHNTAAGLLLVPLVASAVLGATRHPRWWLLGALVALGTAATLSRGVAVVLAGMVVLAAFTASRRRVTLGLAGALAIVVLGLVATSLTLDTSVPAGTAPPGPATQAGAGPLGASVLGRIDLAVRGVETGLDHPLLGIGLGRFASAAGDLPRPNDHAHQAVAHALAEGGVPLAVATVVAALTLAVRGLRAPRSGRRDLVLLAGAGLLVHAQIEILSGRLGHEVLLAVLLGLGAPATNRPARAGREPGAGSTGG
ncbi:O-antigen ligase family protein [Egicoccus halophilus]|uniref:O-antigen ligase-related domain-containing protein n=1 Tax=Egicoccus halophilus TaxID=1670830 RepID=A0A8J3EUJ8_9ACTN|nr:O-antigen ligase family protein [Egicoccus halophilus]GGI06001.1 hypothetical protein GCM10011354_16920 [Egicoccus halophilus]